MLLRWISGVDVRAASAHRDAAPSTRLCHARGNRHPRRDPDPSSVALRGKRHDSAIDSDSICPGHKNVHAIADIYLDRLVHA